MDNSSNTAAVAVHFDLNYVNLISCWPTNNFLSSCNTIITNRAMDTLI